METRNIKIKDLLFLETLEKHTINPIQLIDFNTNIVVVTYGTLQELFDGNIKDIGIYEIDDNFIKSFTFDCSNNRITIMV